MKFTTYNKKDIEKIKHLFTKTFSDSENKEEGLLIGNLVNNLITTTDDQDVYGFIATVNEKIVGSVFFTKITFEKDNIDTFMLSPMAVHTDFQGKKIGQKLINFGLDILKKNGVELVITYGDINFYSKVRFRKITEDIIKAPLKLSYPEGWLAQSLVVNEIELITGKSYCIEAFNNPKYW